MLTNKFLRRLLQRTRIEHLSNWDGFVSLVDWAKIGKHTSTQNCIKMKWNERNLLWWNVEIKIWRAESQDFLQNLSFLSRKRPRKNQSTKKSFTHKRNYKVIRITSTWSEGSKRCIRKSSSLKTEIHQKL